MNNPFKTWLIAHSISAEERAQLANAAGISMSHLYVISNGRRVLTAPMAARLERASLELSRVRTGAVPVLSRGELCQVCAECPHHAAAARKGDAA